MSASLLWTFFTMLVSFTLASSSSYTTRVASTRCTLPGLFCLSCKELGVCVETQGNFIEYLVESCESKMQCSHSLKACSNKPTYCETNEDFKCYHEGLFPDPFDCNVYHECIQHSTDGEKPNATHICEMDTAFNPRSGRCDIPAQDSICGNDSYPVPKCEGDTFQTGPYQLDPNFFWVCVKGKIYMHKCEEGYVYSESSSKCVAGDDESSEEIPSAVFQCSGTGLESDPNSCYRYYDCANPDKPLHLACLIGTYYSPSKERCVLGYCQ